MIKRFFTIIMILALLCSCHKDDDAISINNSEDIENYCIENGWSEVNINVNREMNNTMQSGGHAACIWDETQNCFISYRGNLTFENCNYSCQDLKLYSNFSDLVNAATPPMNGFIDAFTVEDEKFVIQHNFFADVNDYNSRFDGYVKIYMKKINSQVIKVYYKGCSW
ncbi:MAG: hypothetical protein IJ986_05265 [Bacteroidales bacterium]|nr:hypothetical protein [Bacteroidales bacterium]